MRGFLLVECLITISILTLLATTSLHRWQDQQQYLALENASRHLLAFLMQTQSLAAQQQQTLSVQRELTDEGKWCFWITGLSPQDSCQNALLFWKLDEHRVQLLNAHHPSFPVPKFYGNTGATQATRIILTSGSNRIRVVLSSKGRLSRCQEQGSFNTIRSCQ